MINAVRLNNVQTFHHCFIISALFLMVNPLFFSLSFHPELPPLPPTTTPKPGSVTTTRPTTTTVTTHAPGTGFCNGKPDGIYANPDDITTFYMCAHGLTHLKTCSNGSVFDPSSKICVWP